MVNVDSIANSAVVDFRIHAVMLTVADYCEGGDDDQITSAFCCKGSLDARNRSVALQAWQSAYFY